MFVTKSIIMSALACASIIVSAKVNIEQLRVKDRRLWDRDQTLEASGLDFET